MPPSRTPDSPDACLEEFLRRLRASLARLEDDQRFWTRIRADIAALKARCDPDQAFAFETRVVRVLMEFGLTPLQALGGDDRGEGAYATAA